jgi:hypothetical protein
MVVTLRAPEVLEWMTKLTREDDRIQDGVL